MPDKKNENKIMQMLERTGVIRKADSDGSLDFDTSGSDIKPIFDNPDEDVKVTPAARQPVPGMSTPVFPSDKASGAQDDISIDEDDYMDAEEEMASDASAYVTDDYDEEPEPASYEQYEEPEAAPQPVAAAPPEAPKAAPAFSGLNLFKNGNTPEEAPAPIPRESQAENYTDRFLNTEELYEALALRSKKTDSIYLIEEYLQTLPDSLPDAQRRDICNRLIAASGFDYDLLMGDGVLRVKMLKEYAERFARHTDDYIAARQRELDEYDQQILRTRRLIENRKDLHKKQFFSIEAEAQRLKEILTFISG